MKVVSEVEALQRGKPVVLTIGVFDGVHRGHQWLIRQVIERASQYEMESVVLTFDPSPQIILRPGSVQLTNGTEKTRIIETLDPTILVVLPFTRQLSQLSAGQFLAIILAHVNLAEVWVGGDFAFGHDREGDVDFLIKEGQNAGFAVHVAPRQGLEGTLISSSTIRGLVAAGKVEEAADLLGHPFAVTGRVVGGFGRGRELGFPTANVRLPEFQLLPVTGVYAAYLLVDRQRLPAAASVGFNVVFGGQKVSMEAYVLDFDDDLRGKEVRLDFVARVSDEQNFDSVDGLVAKMQDDVARVRGVLG